MLPLDLTFRESVWLFCPAFVLHVIEEWARFTRWAKAHASSNFTRRDYNTIHAVGIAASMVSTLIVEAFPNRTIVYLFFTFFLAPAAFFNAIFHAGASLFTRTYCPGVITALTIYLPLFAWITYRALTEDILGPASMTAALVIAGIVHIWEIGHNVFKAW